MAQGALRGVLPAGTELRGYEMTAILGQGAFGITYRARDLTLHRDVAIKEYLPTTLALREGHTTVVPRSPEHAEQFAWGRERFLEEARTLARLDRTTAIVRVYDFLEANGTAYMIMALVEGESLHRRLQREQQLGPEAIDQLLFPLLDGLEDVHAAGFLHRDIKPANVMVDEKGDPTLIDFGASRAAMAGRTTTMTAIFTPGYAAAEQFTSVRLGPWSDIHGLAATMYHAITGHAPPSAIERIMKDTCVPLAELQPAGFSPALLAGIDAGLAVRAEDRPQSVADWRSLLRGEDPGMSSGEATRVVHRPGRLAHATRRALGGRIGRRTGAGMAVAVLLLVAGGYMALRDDTPTIAVATAPGVTARQLEEALEERRRADALVAEMRELEQEARQKAEAEAKANRQAEAALGRARAARQKAEDDLARLRADIAARREAETVARQQAEVAARQQAELAARQQAEVGQREQAEAALRRAAEEAAQRQAAETARRDAEEAAQRQAEAAAAALRQAEEEAKRKAVAEAEAKRQADEALARVEAERSRAEQEARRKAEAEAAALRQASEDAQRKATAEADKAAAAAAKAKEEAEATEKTLRLDQKERERLQVALTSLGFDTRGTDGVFGPRSREMIGGWQKARNHPATGFLTAPQRQALLKEAAAALAKHDEQKKEVDPPAATSAPQAAPPPAAPPVAALAPPTAPPASAPQSSAASTAVSPGSHDGNYTGILPRTGAGVSGLRITVNVSRSGGSGSIFSASCGTSGAITIEISPAGEVSGEGEIPKLPGCKPGPVRIRGSIDGARLYLTLPGIGRVTLSRGGN